MEQKIIIVGAGLSGLSTAYFLKLKGHTPLLLEASSQLGGRIRTRSGKNDMPLEQGATWVFENHPNLKKLLKELGIKLFEQYREGVGLYESSLSQPLQRFDAVKMSGETPYHRMAGGSSTVIKKLAEELGQENIKLNTAIAQIENNNSQIKLQSTEGEYFSCKKAIICLPPKLLEASITFKPELSKEAQTIRKNTHTWMADSIRFSIQYSSPFWREKGLAGMGFSAHGLLREVQDHVNFENNCYGLIGFMELGSPTLSAEQRKEEIINTLSRIFGEAAKEFLNYQETIWEREQYTSFSGANRGLCAHQNNGHPLLTKAEMNNSLFFAGAETSELVPGYMEAAVISAMRVSAKILDSLG